MATHTQDQPASHDARTRTYDYEHAKLAAGKGIWSVTLPDAPNIAPDDVVVMCIGPRPDDDRYDPYAIDSGDNETGRWIAVALIGQIDGEIDMLTATETTFLENYQWTPAMEKPLPIPETMSTLIGIISGTRSRGETPLPAAAARSVIDAMVMDSMKGHVQQVPPGSRLFQWFANAQFLAIMALAFASAFLISDPDNYAYIARITSIGAMLIASLGIFVDTKYRLETSSILRLPDGYAEGRQRASEHLKVSCLITGFMGLLVFMLSSVLPL